MREVAGQIRAEIDVAEIDEEPLASCCQPALQRQQHVLDLVVDNRELKPGGISAGGIVVVIDLLVEMRLSLLVGDLTLHEPAPVIDRVLRAAPYFEPDAVYPGLVGQNRDDLV